MNEQQQQQGRREMTRASRALVVGALASSLLAFTFGACSLGEGKTPACNPDASKDDPNACQPVAACDDGMGFVDPLANSGVAKDECCRQVAERAIADCLRIQSCTANDQVPCVSIQLGGQDAIVECSPGGELEGDTCPEGGYTGQNVCDVGTASFAACMTRTVGQGGGGGAGGGAGGAGQGGSGGGAAGGSGGAGGAGGN